MNFSDKVAAAISPTWGLKRVSARKALSAVRGYEGATKGRRFLNWKPRKQAQSELWAKESETLRDRARDLVRNNGWGKSARNEYVVSMVGSGMTPKFVDVNAKAVVEDFDRAWDIWANKKFCDYERSKTWTAMLSLIVGTQFTDGECFVRKVIVKDNKYERDPSVVLPGLSFIVLGPDMIDVKKKVDNVKNGIEYKDGRVTAYWVFEENPLENKQAQSIKIPAEEIYHFTHIKEVGQSRGITEFDAAMKPLRDGDEYEDASVIQRKISACMTAFLTGIDTNEDGEASYELPETMEPGTIHTLPPDADVKFSTPPVVSDFAQVTQNQLHKSSAGVGLSYEGVTGDVSKVNYSSLRGSRNAQERNISAIRAIVLLPFLDWAAEHFLMLALAGPQVVATWTPPASLLLDPEKEGKAYESMTRNGFFSLQDVVEKLGKNYNSHLMEIQKNNENLDTAKIVLDSDPRKVTKAGQFQSVPETDT